MHVCGCDHAFRATAGNAADFYAQCPCDFACVGRSFAAGGTCHRFSAGCDRDCGCRFGDGSLTFRAGCFVVYIGYFVIGGNHDRGIDDFGFVVDDEGHGMTDFDGAADIRHRTGQESFLEYFDVHDGFVSFHRGDDVAALNGVADILFPSDHDAFGHSVGELRHDHGNTGVMRDHFRWGLFGDDFTGCDSEIALGVGDVA